MMTLVMLMLVALSMMMITRVNAQVSTWSALFTPEQSDNSTLPGGSVVLAWDSGSHMLHVATTLDRLMYPATFKFTGCVDAVTWSFNATTMAPTDGIGSAIFTPKMLNSPVDSYGFMITTNTAASWSTSFMTSTTTAAETAFSACLANEQVWVLVQDATGTTMRALMSGHSSSSTDVYSVLLTSANGTAASGKFLAIYQREFHVLYYYVEFAGLETPLFAVGLYGCTTAPSTGAANAMLFLPFPAGVGTNSSFRFAWAPSPTSFDSTYFTSTNNNVVTAERQLWQCLQQQKVYVALSSGNSSSPKTEALSFTGAPVTLGVQPPSGTNGFTSAAKSLYAVGLGYPSSTYAKTYVQYMPSTHSISFTTHYSLLATLDSRVLYGCNVTNPYMQVTTKTGLPNDFAPLFASANAKNGVANGMINLTNTAAFTPEFLASIGTSSLESVMANCLRMRRLRMVISSTATTAAADAPYGDVSATFAQTLRVWTFGLSSSYPKTESSAWWKSIWGIYDVVGGQFDVVGQYTGLSGAPTLAHIHACTSSAYTGDAGVALNLPLAAPFTTNATAGSGYLISEKTTLAKTSWGSAFLTANGGAPIQANKAMLTCLLSGQAYMNIHTASYPSGEIRAYILPDNLPVGKTSPSAPPTQLPTTPTPTQSTTTQPPGRTSDAVSVAVSASSVIVTLAFSVFIVIATTMVTNAQ